MAKYKLQDKKKYIELMLSGKHSTRSAAKNLNVNRSTANRWWKMYEIHGHRGLMMKASTYDSNFKIYAVKYMYENHLSASEASANLGIPSVSLLWNWMNIYNKKGECGLLDIKRRGRPKKYMRKDKNIKIENTNIINDITLLQEENIKLKAEIAYLKKYNALVQQKKNLSQKKKH